VWFARGYLQNSIPNRKSLSLATTFSTPRYELAADSQATGRYDRLVEITLEEAEQHRGCSLYS
jgi:hypothetical protein